MFRRLLRNASEKVGSPGEQQQANAKSGAGGASPNSHGGGSGTPPVNQDNQEEIQGFVCPMCMQTFHDSAKLQLHFDTEHNDIPIAEPVVVEKADFICQRCQLVFPSPESLSSHMDLEHSEIAKKIGKSGFLCPNCRLSFQNAEDLKSHFEQAHMSADYTEASSVSSRDTEVMQLEIDTLRASLDFESSKSLELEKEIEKLKVTAAAAAPPVDQVT